MKWFYRGRHRANRFSQPVRELIWECRRIPIQELFRLRDEMWAQR